jgi:hypothetical protein
VKDKVRIQRNNKKNKGTAMQKIRKGLLYSVRVLVYNPTSVGE